MQIGYVLIIEDYHTLLGVIITGNAIEQTCFTCPIGTDNCHQFTSVDDKVDLFDRNYTAKA
jgi:hypothetical protein